MDNFRIASGSTRPVPTTLSLPKANGTSTAELTVATGWNITTDLDVILYRRQLNTTTGLYEKVDGTQTEWVASLTGTTLSSMDLRAGTEPASGYAADGNTVVLCGPTSAWADDLVNALLETHDQDGTLKSGAVDVAAVLASDVVTTTKVIDSAITSAKVATGFLVQTVSTNYSAVATGTTTIPFDDTIPQITEGTEFMTQAITPKSTTNILVIHASTMSTLSTADDIIMALFQDSTANALAATAVFNATGTGRNSLTLQFKMAAGTTSATTFRIRIGGANASTVTFNGATGARKFGGITLSNITIMEYKA